MLTVPPRDLVPTTEDRSITTTELSLEGMHCNACATRIERSLAGSKPS